MHGYLEYHLFYVSGVPSVLSVDAEGARKSLALQPTPPGGRERRF